MEFSLCVTILREEWTEWSYKWPRSGQFGFDKSAATIPDVSLLPGQGWRKHPRWPPQTLQPGHSVTENNEPGTDGPGHLWQ